MILLEKQTHINVATLRAQSLRARPSAVVRSSDLLLGGNFVIGLLKKKKKKNSIKSALEYPKAPKRELQRIVSVFFSIGERHLSIYLSIIFNPLRTQAALEISRPRCVYEAMYFGDSQRVSHSNVTAPTPLLAC